MHAAERERDDVQRRRKEWQEFQSTAQIEHLVFLDESSINTGMTRLYGRAASNERVIDATPDVRFHQTTILSSVRLSGEQVPCVFDGALTGKLFVAYLREFLVPTLHEGDIVIMDNLSSHKVKGVQETLASAGATAMYLPPYSPDLNPIELLWSKLKAWLRKLMPRAIPALMQDLCVALGEISSSDISSWFRHSHYS